jgi:protein-S-isoprenylcysteine O-methyltransferase Ste14
MATRHLGLKLIGGVIYSVVFLGGPLFLAAWTWDWWQAWVFTGVVFILSAITMFGIFPSRPDLLDERYKPIIQKGQPLADKVLTPILAISFFGLILFIPRDVFRFHLLGVASPWVAALGLLLFAAGWTVIALALRANAFAAPVVKHQETRGQAVVQTGPYAIVRHPMYAGAVPLMIGMPLWLGSIAGAVLAFVPLGVLVIRIRIEEALLRRELAGYVDYAKRVRWRLIPGIW